MNENGYISRKNEYRWPKQSWFTGDKQNLTKNWDVVGIKLITSLHYVKAMASAASLLHLQLLMKLIVLFADLITRLKKDRSPAFLKGKSTGNIRKPWCFSPNLGSVLWMFPSSHFFGMGINHDLWNDGESSSIFEEFKENIASTSLPQENT